MSAPPYMKLFWGDYHKATRHLRRDQHGAYFLLIGEAWRLGGSLPDDDRLLSAWALCADDEWAEMKPVIMDFFALRRGKWIHDRVREELASYETTSRKRKEAGRKGGSVSGGKHGGNTQAIAKLKPTKPEPEPEPKKETTPDGVVAPKRIASRLPADWSLDPDGFAYAERQGFDPAAIGRMAERFGNYWRAKSGKDAAKLDWPATWRNWVLAEVERRPSSAQPRRAVGFV